jgi:OOP family OmpA-OmpF porin
MIIPDQHIEFDGETAALSKESEKPLQQVRQALFVNPQYLLVEIGVHTNYPGGDEKNLALSLKRAEAIKTWLVNHGIDPARLTAEGYGNSRPLVLGLSEANMKKNRRVEIKVLTTKH